MVGEWSIAVDDCMPFLNARYVDVGQCDHIDLRHDDPYWQAHLRCVYMFVCAYVLFIPNYSVSRVM